MSSSWPFASQNLWDPTALRAVASFHYLAACYTRTLPMHQFGIVFSESSLNPILCCTGLQACSCRSTSLITGKPVDLSAHGTLAVLLTQNDIDWNPFKWRALGYSQHMLLNISYAAKCCLSHMDVTWQLGSVLYTLSCNRWLTKFNSPGACKEGYSALRGPKRPCTILFLHRAALQTLRALSECNAIKDTL